MRQIKVQFPILEAPLSGAEVIVSTSPLDKTVLRINVPSYMLSGRYANAFQKHLMDEGSYRNLLPFYQSQTWEWRRGAVLFRSKKSIAFKELAVEFDYMVQSHERGWWVYVPVLAIETFVNEESELEAAAQELVQMDFVRNQRLEFLQDVLATIWFETPQLRYEEILLTAYTPGELEAKKNEQKRGLLPSVAERVRIDTRQMFGNEAEIKQLTEILNGQYNRCVLLVGPSGVGKSTLVWEVMYRLRDAAPRWKLWETTASVLIKELTKNTGWQENLSALCRELTEEGDVLFIRNMLEIFEVGQYEGNNVSMGEYMREYIGRGEVAVISECTDEELAIIEARVPNYASLFNLIRLEEPKDDLESIVLQKVHHLASARRATIEPEAIRETIRLNKRYMPYSGFPRKPIRFLESILLNGKHLSTDTDRISLNENAILKAFCEEAGMPPFMVHPQIPMDLALVREFFRSNVFGQNHAIEVLLDLLASVKMGVLRQGKPIASLLFVGPTGVGKTELAKVLAEFMFGNRERMIRSAISDFSTPYAIARLTGESYYSDGLLTSAVRREPFCVLLFDELEKAHPDFNDLLLQMLGEGRLTDSQGKLVNFCSTIIIMTSNIGAQKIQNTNIGWGREESPHEVAEYYENEVRKHFRPEIFNRIDQIVPFHPLDKGVVRFVVERELGLLRRREGISARNIELKLAESLFDYLGERGYHPKYGARALQRGLREELVIPLAKHLNEYAFDEKLVVEISAVADKIAIEIESDPFKLDLMLEELTQNEYMDYASELRRRIAQMGIGNFYTRLVSELESLEHEQRRNSKRFWADENAPKQIVKYTTIRQRVQTATARIEQLENEMALISLGINKLNTKLYDQIKQWEADYFDLKVEILAQMDPNSNEAVVGLYGKTKRFMQFYTEICQEHGFQMDARTVWYRDSLYNELVEVKPAETEENEDGEVVLRESDPNAHLKAAKVAARVYYYRPFNWEKPEKNFRPEESEDKYLGIELLLKGRAVQWYFQPEGGMHCIKHDDNSELCYVAVGHPSGYAAPDEIHRKNHKIWKEKPRRIYHDNELEDNEFNITKRRMTKVEQTKTLIAQLDKRFSTRLDELLQG